MKFLPTSDAERAAMLAAIGVALDRRSLRVDPGRGAPARPNLPPPMSEIEIRRFLGGLAQQNANARDTAFFLGAGLSTTTTSRRSPTRCSTARSG